MGQLELRTGDRQTFVIENIPPDQGDQFAQPDAAQALLQQAHKIYGDHLPPSASFADLAPAQPTAVPSTTSTTVPGALQQAGEAIEQAPDSPGHTGADSGSVLGRIVPPAVGMGAAMLMPRMAGRALPFLRYGAGAAADYATRRVMEPEGSKLGQAATAALEAPAAAGAAGWMRGGPPTAAPRVEPPTLPEVPLPEAKPPILPKAYEPPAPAPPRSRGELLAPHEARAQSVVESAAESTVGAPGASHVADVIGDPSIPEWGAKLQTLEEMTKTGALNGENLGAEQAAALQAKLRIARGIYEQGRQEALETMAHEGAAQTSYRLSSAEAAHKADEAGAKALNDWAKQQTSLEVTGAKMTAAKQQAEAGFKLRTDIANAKPASSGGGSLAGNLFRYLITFKLGALHGGR